ncbi:MAG: hypothetical protein CL721_05930, partial [Chloroflexi bacterium]|nr:hypothetical protein [Chloroflexota bacterium]
RGLNSGEASRILTDYVCWRVKVLKAFRLGGKMQRVVYDGFKRVSTEFYGCICRYQSSPVK